MRLPFSVPPAGSRAFDVVGIGQNSIDLVAVVSEYPASNTKQRLQRFARHPGGQIATALVACRRLGWTARYVGYFGGDDLGSMSRESLLREGVNVEFAPAIAGSTNQFAIILVDARTGERTVLWDRDPALTMPGSEVPIPAILSGRMLLVDGDELAASTEAARAARAAGIPTVVDVETVRPGVADLLRQIDAIIAAEEFPCELTGHDDVSRALTAMADEFGASLVCATLGDGGSLAFCGGREIRTRAFPVDCVDSTGAGDVFRGGFVAACLAAPEGGVEAALSYANAAAALNCRTLGARGGLPTREEVELLLRSRV